MNGLVDGWLFYWWIKFYIQASKLFRVIEQNFATSHGSPRDNSSIKFGMDILCTRENYSVHVLQRLVSLEELFIFFKSIRELRARIYAIMLMLFFIKLWDWRHYCRVGSETTTIIIINTDLFVSSTDGVIGSSFGGIHSSQWKTRVTFQLGQMWIEMRTLYRATWSAWR